MDEEQLKTRIETLLDERDCIYERYKFEMRDNLNQVMEAQRDYKRAVTERFGFKVGQVLQVTPAFLRNRKHTLYLQHLECNELIVVSVTEGGEMEAIAIGGASNMCTRKISTARLT